MQYTFDVVVRISVNVDNVEGYDTIDDSFEMITKFEEVHGDFAELRAETRDSGSREELFNRMIGK